MAFNIDEDTINANWLRWKNWDVPVGTLPELLALLGLEEATPEQQQSQVKRLAPYFDKAPEQLRHEAENFLRDYPTA